jgi:DNA polymerase III epsilon subunit-like protein
MKQPYNNMHLPPSGHHTVAYGQTSPVAVYDYWQQAGPSRRNWSAESASSESSGSFDQNEGSPGSASINRKRRDRKSWRPQQSSPPSASPMYTSAPSGYQNHPTPRKSYRPAPKYLPDWSPDQCVGLDAEMVGVGLYGEASSVARVVVVDWDGQVIFDEYIKQTQPVTDYRTFVSGITPEHLSTATLSLRDARKRILKILYGRLLIGHALKNDLKALGISHPWWLIRDTARYEPFMQTFGPDASLWPRKLKDLSLEKLGSNIQTYGKPHSPCEDATAALDLYKTVQVEWEQLMQKKVSKTNEIQTEERNFQKEWVKQNYEWAQQQQMAYMQHMQQQMMWQQHQLTANHHYSPTSTSQHTGP